MKKTQTEKSKQWYDTLPPDERHLYMVRQDLIRRCYNKHRNNYPRYGGRGIRVCPEWRQSWPAFRDWALSHGYRQGLQIDRIDNNAGYSPQNCHFVTCKENNRNKRNNRHITFRGETHLLIEWSERTGIRTDTLQVRLDRRGWSVERALTTPVNKKYWSRRRTIEKEFEKSKQQSEQSDQQLEPDFDTTAIITSATSEEEVKAIEDMQKALLLPNDDNKS